MQIQALDHVNIRTPDVPATTQFFVDVLNMRAEPTPGMNDMTRGAWVFDASSRAAIHITSYDVLYPWEDPKTKPAIADAGTGRIHHVALRCSGYEAVRDRLDERSLVYHPNEVPQIGLRQLFLKETNGVILELNFFAD